MSKTEQTEPMTNATGRSELTRCGGITTNTTRMTSRARRDQETARKFPNGFASWPHDATHEGTGTVGGREKRAGGAESAEGRHESTGEETETVEGRAGRAVGAVATGGVESWDAAIATEAGPARRRLPPVSFLKRSRGPALIAPLEAADLRRHRT